MKNNYNIGTILFSIATGLGFVYIIRSQQPPPKIYINLVYEILHYGVHCYSRAQIIKNKYMNQIYKIKFIEKNTYQLKELFMNDIEIIKYNKVLLRCKSKNVIMYNPLYMDFFIYSDIHNSPVNKIVCKDVYSFMKNYNKCNFKLCSLSLILSAKEHYNIRLSTEDYNYYIVGNIIDKYLILYLLYRQHGIDIVDAEDVSYMIEMIDNNMELVYVSEKNIIILLEDSYKIKDVNYVRDDTCFNVKNYLKITDNMKFKKNEENEENEENDSFVEI